MASTAEIKKVLQQLHREPELLDQVLNAADDDERKNLFVERGLVRKGNRHGPTRDEVEDEIRKLVKLPPRRRDGDDEERAVEWVAAIGTAAAGAAAAFCAAG